MTWSLQATTLVSLRRLKWQTPPLHTKSLLSSHTSSDRTVTHAKGVFMLNLVCFDRFLPPVFSWMPKEKDCGYSCIVQTLSYLKSLWTCFSAAWIADIHDIKCEKERFGTITLSLSFLTKTTTLKGWFTHITKTLFHWPLVVSLHEAMHTVLVLFVQLQLYLPWIFRSLPKLNQIKDFR